MKRAKEKYSIYLNNGYHKMYFIESYCWEIMKYLYAKIYN